MPKKTRAALEKEQVDAEPAEEAFVPLPTSIEEEEKLEREKEAEEKVTFDEAGDREIIEGESLRSTPYHPLLDVGWSEKETVLTAWGFVCLFFVCPQRASASTSKPRVTRLRPRPRSRRGRPPPRRARRLELRAGGGWRMTIHDLIFLDCRLVVREIKPFNRVPRLKADRGNSGPRRMITI
jgi:hypothetical protein